MFHHGCGMGLEGIISKRRDAPYRSGRSPHWIKVKPERTGCNAHFRIRVIARTWRRGPVLEVEPTVPDVVESSWADPKPTSDWQPTYWPGCRMAGIPAD